MRSRINLISGFLVLVLPLGAHAQTQVCVPSGTTNCTTNLNLFLPVSQAPNWDQLLNNNFIMLDKYLGNQAPLPSGIGAPFFNAGTGFQINGNYGTAGQFLQSTGTGSVWATIQAQTQAYFNATNGYQLNGSYGTAGQFLQSTGTGSVWATVTAPGSSTPGGNNGEIQWNNSGALGGTTGMTWSTVGQYLNNPNGAIGAQYLGGSNAIGAGLGAGFSNRFSYNASTGGLSAGLLACMNVDATVHVCPTGSPVWSGITFVTSGSQSLAELFIGGTAACVFDNQTTIADYVTISAVTPGYCHDAGSALPAAGVPVVGMAMAANTGASTNALVDIFSPGVSGVGGTGGGGGGGTPPGGSNTQMQYNNSGAFAGTAGLTWNAGANYLVSTGPMGASHFVTTGGFGADPGAGFESDFSYNPSVGGLQLSYLACLNADGTVHLCASSAPVVAGITQALSTSQASVTTGGQDVCVFDNQTVVGDFVQAGASGQCHDTINLVPGIAVVGQTLTANTGNGSSASVFVFSSGLTAATPAVPVYHLAVSSFAIPANTCYGSAGSTTPSTFPMPGVALGMRLTAGFQGDPSAVNGWGAVGGLNIAVWASAANQGSFKICNSTTASITGGGINFAIGAQ